MATTSLWHIKGRLSDLIAYFFNVFSYIQNPQKTADGSFVTAINCLKETALRQMILTKQRYGKEDKYIAWHGYQSFQPGEVTPELCHEIGVKLAREMWGDRFQVIVTTCTITFVSIRYRLKMARSTTTPRPSSSGSGTPQTGFAGSMGCPLLSMAARPPAAPYGWMSRAESLPAITSTGRTCGMLSTAAEPWR